MKLNKLLITSLAIGTLQLPTITMSAFADEGAKTVTGEILPASTDTDGDGWANVDFDPSALPAADLEKVNQLTNQKGSGQLSQIEYNEQVSAIFKQAIVKQQSIQTQQGLRPYGGIPPQGMTPEQYAELEQNVPSLNSVDRATYNHRINMATQNIADKYHITIYAPQHTFIPQSIATDVPSTETVPSTVTTPPTDAQTTVTQLPDTGEENHSTGIIVAGILLLAFGLKLMVRRA